MPLRALAGIVAGRLHFHPRAMQILITGGAGFIATNLAHRLLDDGHHVILLDNLSRTGVEQNLAWLLETHRSGLVFVQADIRDSGIVRECVRQVSQVFHFAAQVAVTTSLSDPVLDFSVNAVGTLTLLEAIRRCDRPPSLLFTSTNKVYGHLDDLPLVARGLRYEPADANAFQRGIDESHCLEFHSPYGCSKGVAEQYVLDYARTFGLRTIVFRMSCIYGPHQFGTEDQGWIAHFLIAGLQGRPLTIYGDGFQVRDILFVDDLVEAMLLAQERIDVLSGQAFNIGGGVTRAVSLLELMELLGELLGVRPHATFEAWRPADQRYYVSDTTRFERATGWRPRIGARSGVRRLRDWLVEARGVGPSFAAEVAS